MATNESPRRIVVWSDGCARAERIVAWAAKHAAGRTVPLHILQFSAAVALSGSGAGPMQSGFAERDPAAVDVVRVAHEMRRIQAEHHELPVTFEVLHEMSPQRVVEMCGDGDLLVTDSATYLRLAGDETPATVPVVIVPEQLGKTTGAHGVLFVPGRRMSRPVADFAFRTAADLGLKLDLVRVESNSPAFGDDYWIDSGKSAERPEPDWEAESTRLRGKFPQVNATSWVLRTRPAATLGAMARSARLAVVGNDAHRELRALLDAGACPVAVIPEA